MSLLEVARDTLKDLPISDILRERLSLALDQSADSERQNAILQKENGSLQAQLEREQLDNKQTEQELARLKKMLEEEIRIIRSVEFRRGVRTGGQWLPFCPKCHLPLSPSAGEGRPFCNDEGKCGWVSMLAWSDVNDFVSAEL